MTFEEFENTLQDWLDEGRLDEADALVLMVDKADRPQCEELLLAYRSLFVGLAASAPAMLSTASQPIPAATPQPSPAVAPYPTPATWQRAALPGLALALSLCLTLVAIVPGMLSSPEAEAVAPVEALTSTQAPLETDSSADLAHQSDLARLRTLSFEPFAHSMATQTDRAFRSLHQFGSTAADFNPIDDQLAAYWEAAPLIDTLTRSLMPGTHSLSDAFSVLQESTDKPSTISADPTAPAPLESTENASVS